MQRHERLVLDVHNEVGLSIELGEQQEDVYRYALIRLANVEYQGFVVSSWLNDRVK
jgi:hypothetical protein